MSCRGLGEWPVKRIVDAFLIWKELAMEVTTCACTLGTKLCKKMNTLRCLQRASFCGFKTVHLRRQTAEQQKVVPDVKPVMNFVPLVITTLEFPYHGATAPRACVPGRRATYPDRRRLVLHSFSEQDPPISQSLRRGFGYTQREMGLPCFAYESSVSTSWQRLVHGYTLFDTRRLISFVRVGLLYERYYVILC